MRLKFLESFSYFSNVTIITYVITPTLPCPLRRTEHAARIKTTEHLFAILHSTKTDKLTCPEYYPFYKQHYRALDYYPPAWSLACIILEPHFSHKQVILPPSHRLNANVMLSNITFFDFAVFEPSPLTLWINRCLLYLYLLICY